MGVETQSWKRKNCKRGEEGGEKSEEKQAPLSCTPPLPSQKALTHEGGGTDGGWGWEAGWGGWTAGGGGAITVIAANLTVGPDGCRGQAICLRGGACPKEALPYHQGQGPMEGVPESRKGKEDQEVLAWHSCPWRDPAVSEEHWTPNLEAPLLTASPWDSPRSGQKRPALLGEHHHMPAGSCRSILGVSHGRHQPMHHTCEKGNYYAQGHSVSLPHPRRASMNPKSSSKQANLLFVGCVGFFLFVCV